MVKLSQFIKNYDVYQSLWLAAYIFTLLLPLGLIFSRSFAEICIIFIGVLWLVYCIGNNRWQWLGDPVVKLGLLAWGWLLIISLFSNWQGNSFGVAVPWVRYIFFYIAIKDWVLSNKKPLYIFSVIMLAMLCFVIIDTTWQYIFGISLTGNIRDVSGRLTGPINNVKVGIFTAKMLLPVIGIYLFFAIDEKKIFNLVFSILVLIAAICMILVTGERTAFVSTIIGMGFSALLIAISEPRLRKPVTITAFAVIILALLLFVTQDWVKVRAYDFYTIILTYPQTNYGKLAIAGFNIGAEHPLTGAGLKGFRELCPKLTLGGEIDYCNLHPHNPYMEWFAETGAIGLLFFIIIVGYMIYICLKNFMSQNGVYRILPAFALACIITNFFPFMPTQSMFSNWSGILLWYSVSTAIASLNVLRY